MKANQTSQTTVNKTAEVKANQTANATTAPSDKKKEVKPTPVIAKKDTSPPAEVKASKPAIVKK